MVEPAKARGPGRPSKTNAQKPATCATQTSVPLPVVVQPQLVKHCVINSNSPAGSKIGTLLKMINSVPQNWASVVHGACSNGGSVPSASSNPFVQQVHTSLNPVRNNLWISYLNIETPLQLKRMSMV
ncbi:unnamed protein product [Amaranthus hypochondriacus]